MGTGAGSRYNVDRSHKFVKVQDLNCGQMRALPTEAERRWVSGCNGNYEFVLGAGAKVEDPPTGGDEIPSWRGKNRDKLMNYTDRVSTSDFNTYLVMNLF
jgi:hypothetical protein